MGFAAAPVNNGEPDSDDDDFEQEEGAEGGEGQGQGEYSAVQQQQQQEELDKARDKVRSTIALSLKSSRFVSDSV